MESNMADEKEASPADGQINEFGMRPQSIRTRLNEGYQAEMEIGPDRKKRQKLDAKKKLVFSLDKDKKRIPLEFKTTRTGKDGKLIPGMDLNEFGSFKLVDDEGNTRHIAEDAQEIVDVFKDYGLNGWHIQPIDPRTWLDPHYQKKIEAAKPGRSTII